MTRFQLRLGTSLDEATLAPAIRNNLRLCISATSPTYFPKMTTFLRALLIVENQRPRYPVFSRHYENVWVRVGVDHINHDLVLTMQPSIAPRVHRLKGSPSSLARSATSALVQEAIQCSSCRRTKLDLMVSGAYQPALAPKLPGAM